MEFDNPAVGGGWDGVGEEQSDFSDREKGKEKREKNLLGTSKKKDKDKKKRKRKKGRKRNTICEILKKGRRKIKQENRN